MEFFIGYSGDINDRSVNLIQQELVNAKYNGASRINLCITSSGGGINPGIGLYNFIRAFPIEVHAFNTSFVGSIASIIFVAANRRLVSKHSVCLIHGSTNGVTGNVIRLTDIRDSLVLDEKRIDAILTERTKLNDRQIFDRKMRDMYMSPDQAVECGLAHEIKELDIPPDAHVIQVTV